MFSAFAPLHNNPDKFGNGVFAWKTDKMFSVHTIVFISLSIFSPFTLIRVNLKNELNAASARDEWQSMPTLLLEPALNSN